MSPRQEEDTYLTHTAPHVIGRKTILIKKDTILPQTWRLEEATHWSGWDTIAIAADHQAMKEELVASGWTWFYMAGEISATAFGLDQQSMMRTALRRLITLVKSSECNCVEIDDVATCSFLGMSRVRVSGHARHIQKGIFFSPLGPVNATIELTAEIAGMSGRETSET